MIKFVDVNDDPFGAEITYALMEERPPEFNISHKVLPTWAAHVHYVKRHPYRKWAVIRRDQVGAQHGVGALYITNKNEIGIGIMRAFQDRGYAGQALLHLLKTIPPLGYIAGERSGEWLANIAPGNPVSQRVFQQIGFQLVQMTYRMGGLYGQAVCGDGEKSGQSASGGSRQQGGVET